LEKRLLFKLSSEFEVDPSGAKTFVRLDVEAESGHFSGASHCVLREQDLRTWRELPAGGRLYSYDVRGRSGWRATYVKEVDAEELTVTFYQEVYDAAGTLREVHHKYPVDLGHQQVSGDKP